MCEVTQNSTPPTLRRDTYRSEWLATVKRWVLAMAKIVDTLPDRAWARRSCFPHIYVLWDDQDADDPVGLVDIEAREATLTPEADDAIIDRLHTCGVSTERQDAEVTP